MEVIIEDCTENGEEKIERACRTCYSSWYRFDPPKSTSELIQKVIKKRHFSVLEHAHATFRLKNISRVLTHELVRHRLFSFSQESQRYVCYADTPDRNKTKDFMWIFPDTIFDYEIESYHNNKEFADPILQKYNELIKQCYDYYEEMLKAGVPPEDARYILPNATCTEIVVSGNLRTWREFLIKRCHPRAHWEIREVAEEIKDQLINLFPNVFFDFVKGEMTEKQIEEVNR